MQAKTRNKLREIRKRCGLTLKDVARLINTTEASVSRYEKEDSRLNIPLIYSLAEKLHCSPTEIIGAGTPFDGQRQIAKEIIGAFVEICQQTGVPQDHGHVTDKVMEIYDMRVNGEISNTKDALKVACR